MLDPKEDDVVSGRGRKSTAGPVTSALPVPAQRTAGSFGYAARGHESGPEIRESP